jgi:hypothetical protein
MSIAVGSYEGLYVVGATEKPRLEITKCKHPYVILLNEARDFWYVLWQHLCTPRLPLYPTLIDFMVHFLWTCLIILMKTFIDY